MRGKLLEAVSKKLIKQKSGENQINTREPEIFNQVLYSHCKLFLKVSYDMSIGGEMNFCLYIIYVYNFFKNFNKKPYE